MYILSIDPSIRACGIAIFKDKQLIRYELIQPSKEYMNDAADVNAWYMRAFYVWVHLKELYQHYAKMDKIKVVLEVPEYWNVAGFAARESGSIFKLSFLCGMIYTLGDIQLYTPRQWKGQMNKLVVANRLSLHYTKIDFKELDHNIADAIGIGRKYLFGRI